MTPFISSLPFSAFPLLSLLISPFSSSPLLAPQLAISQLTPVKLFSARPRLTQRLHGRPERSKARRPALIAPVLALGPSLGARGVWPMRLPLASTGSPGRGFFFGPGLPRGFGAPSGPSEGTERFEPGLGPGMPFLRAGCAGGGARASLNPVSPSGLGVASAGVVSGSEGDASMTDGWTGAPEADGDEGVSVPVPVSLLEEADAGMGKRDSLSGDRRSVTSAVRVWVDIV